MPPAYAPPPESVAPPSWIGDARGLLEFASRLAFTTRLPAWQEAPAHEALLRLAADVALQLQLHEPHGIGLEAGIARLGSAPQLAEEAGKAATQEELALALRRASAEPEAFWFG